MRREADMKTVYFVRHGQSKGNVEPVFQAADSPLTEEGKRQAHLIAKRCAKLPIQIILASTQLRAKETAEIITGKTGTLLEFSDLFRERRKPSALNGKSFSDPAANDLNEQWVKSLLDEGPRAGDGENFADVSQRAGKALDFLLKRTEDEILVVTHGVFMRYIVARAMYGEELTGRDFSKLAQSMVMENTGITVLRHDAPVNILAWGELAPWQLWVWNDHAHLG